MADDLAALLEEKQRREGKVTGGYTSVLETPKKTTATQEAGKFVESLAKGAAKGLVPNIIGGWGNVYDVATGSEKPSALSSQGIVNALAKQGIDLNKIRGYEGAYKFGEAGAPAAAMSLMMPGAGLFSPTAKGIAGEFGVAGATGVLSQMVAPESMGAQVAMQSLPYLVKGGYDGMKSRAQQKRISEFQSNLPADQQNIFKEFMLKGQGSTDPVIAEMIQRVSSNPKFAELVSALNEGATAKALSEMAPKAGKLTPEESKVGIIQAVQNKLAGIRESNADSLFEKAKGYGSGQGLVDPIKTIEKIDGLINRYSNQATPNAERAVQVLQDIRSRLSPSFNVEGRGSFTYSSPSQARDTLTNAPIPGQPVSYTIPGGKGYSVNQGPQKLTIEEVQGLLSEFGKKASAGDNLIKDLSISDERIISSAIFGGMKDDVSSALKTASGADKSALNLLNAARDKVAKSSTAYNDAIAQGLPAFLHNKSLAEISPEDLYKSYKNLTPAQRGTMRSWVSSTDQAALDVIDKQVFTDFVNQAKKPNMLGVETVDLATLAKNWRELEKIPGAQDALVTSLGTNASEFGQRMRDAEIFTRKMQVSKPQAAGDVIPRDLERDLSAAAGAIGSYPAAKSVTLGVDAINALAKNGLTDEQLMKLLLPKEGADFLKNAALSPRSEKTLESLTAAEKSTSLPKWAVQQTVSAVPRTGTVDQPMVQQESNAQQDDLAALLEEQARRQQEQQNMAPTQ